MDIVNGGINAENKEKLEQLEAAVLREKNRQLAEALAAAEERLRKSDEFTELVAEQKAQERFDKKMAEDAAVAEALAKAAEMDAKPYVPQKVSRYEDYLVLSNKHKSLYMELYDKDGHLDELRAEHSRRIQREQELAKIGLKSKK